MMLDELHTFEGLVARRAYRHLEGRLPHAAEVERERVLAQAEAQRSWLRRKARRAAAKRLRHAA